MKLRWVEREVKYDHAHKTERVLQYWQEEKVVSVDYIKGVKYVSGPRWVDYPLEVEE